MSRVIFDHQVSAPQVNRTRADVACCVGLMRRLSGASVSTSVVQWLQYLGFPAAQIASLTNVPIPIESYAAFTALYDDGSSGSAEGTDYSATAVRSFFAQGGKKCYVVRVDDPVSDADSAAGKANKLAGLLGSLLPAPGSLPDGPLAWKGVGALGALEEVSLLLLPDLPALCASAPVGAVGQTPVVPLGPQEFTVCSPGPVVPRQQSTFNAPAPRLAGDDYATWANVVAAVLNYLAGGVLRHQLHLREIQFVAAFPLPQDLDAAAAAENPSSEDIAQDIHDVISAYLPEQVLPGNGVLTLTPLQVPAKSPLNISSAFLQLGYPWLKTSGSSLLLEQLEPPDGALAGLIARNALTRGTFTSATKIVPAEIYEVMPALPAKETKSSATPLIWGSGSAPKPLIARLSLFGMTAAGLRLLSDVTAYPGETYRTAAVNRLVSVICRSARKMGESAIFQSNGPSLWGKVQRFLQNLMTRLWMLNALDGATVEDAFSVRCDQSTMTQNDLDTGRLIALLTFTAASTLETLHVQLAMEAGGTSVQEITANLSTAASQINNAAAAGMAGNN
jgi:hypothetical protein